MLVHCGLTMHPAGLQQALLERIGASAHIQTCVCTQRHGSFGAGPDRWAAGLAGHSLPGLTPIQTWVCTRKQKRTSLGVTLFSAGSGCASIVAFPTTDSMCVCADLASPQMCASCTHACGIPDSMPSDLFMDPEACQGKPGGYAEGGVEKLLQGPTSNQCALSRQPPTCTARNCLGTLFYAVHLVSLQERLTSNHP